MLTPAKMSGIALFTIVAGYGLFERWNGASEFARTEKSIVRTAITLDDKYLDSYAGRYELRDGFEVVISHSAGQVYAQATNQPKVEFFAASPTVFFNNITPLLIKFEANVSGRADRFQALEPGKNRTAIRVDE